MSSVVAPQLDLDPFDPVTLANPAATERAIREAGDLVWLKRYGVYATGRYDVAREIFMDWERFSSAYGTGMTNIRRETPWRKPSVILEVDPPAHAAARKVLMRALSPIAIKSLQVRFQTEADAMVEALVTKGHFDAARELAFAFPFKVLPDAVGLRPESREHLIPYATLNFNAMGPKNALYEAALEVVEREGTFAFVEWQCSRENILPGGFGEAIYNAADAGEIDPDDAALLVRTFLSAGIDTTILGIGLTLWHLARHPEQWQQLVADPSLAKAAFEETLRLTPPSPVIGRTTSHAFNFRGIDLPAEQKVLMFLGAANRDPQRWDSPEDFDIHRRTSGHLAFGTGIHGCVGQAIARLEAESVLGALARRIRSFELTADPKPLLNNWLHGFESMPIRVRAK